MEIVDHEGFFFPAKTCSAKGSFKAADSLFTAEHGKLREKRWTKLHRGLICGV